MSFPSRPASTVTTWERTFTGTGTGQPSLSLLSRVSFLFQRSRKSTDQGYADIWGNFIVHGDPRISQNLACGTNCDPRTADMTQWKPWNREHPVQLSANMTGGTPALYNAAGTLVPSIAGPGLSNSYTLSDGVTWEGGRGNRCKFLQEMGPKIPQ